LRGVGWDQARFGGEWPVAVCECIGLEDAVTDRVIG
jgi:hypothetical protein